MIPPLTLGWMAGIIDLKGRLVYKLNKQRATDQIVLLVESKEIAIIRRLGSLTGTRPEAKKALPLKDFMRRGCSDHCPEAHVHVNELSEDRVLPPSARWTITGAGMVVVINSLLPYLVIDRGWEDAMVRAKEVTTLTGQGSNAVFATLTRLRDLGWELPELYEDALQMREGRSS